ncbi:hypothetical protein GCM10010937_11240 [Gluconobacter japonicus]|uniref:Uncharacterized protein n=1 Tax=Gluconobacter japonicus TaxID=376620 RepID=A0ABQ5WHS7_GLUJA|nr:hypothetical protein AA3271_2292 [Gluconobacter japonicus NBRC 3271]GLQ59321.1 hypothetical protein GCM10010937_11240 [Gluconobacter japonicus]
MGITTKTVELRNQQDSPRETATRHGLDKLGAFVVLAALNLSERCKLTSACLGHMDSNGSLLGLDTKP